MSARQMIDRACHSLGGHVLLFEVALSLPLFLVFLLERLQKSAVSFEWVLRVASVAALSGAVAGVVFWFALSRNLIRAKGSQPRR